MADAAPLTLVCLAPLTNVALALVKQPAIAAKIRRVVLMGGAQRSGGNVTPSATFNMVCDPHAAQVVFTSGCPLVVVNLDVTSQVVIRETDLRELAAFPGAIARSAHDMLLFFNQRRMAVYGCSEDEMSLNDPCVIAYLLAPDLFSGRHVNVAIEHRAELTMGCTVVDRRGVSGRPPNALWLDQVDATGVRRLLLKTLSR